MIARGVVAELPIASIARALGPLCEQVVFWGGAFAALLYCVPVVLHPRATDDVDGVAATASYGDFHRLESALRNQGFRQELRDTSHMHRWRSPQSIKFDLVPCGAHAGGTGSLVDLAAVRTAVSLEIETGLVIHHASGPAFLAQKILAYRDRGRADPLESDDLTDILSLVASRPELIGEVWGAPPELREVVVAGIGEILRDPNGGDLIAAHLSGAQEPASTIAAALERLNRLLQERERP